jgi:hypothetical protein
VRGFDQAGVFLGVLPLALILSLLSGLTVAGAYLGAIAFCSFALALRGRIGAAPFFPLRACFYAPIWLFERSVCVYWALLLELTGTREPDRIPVPSRGERVASGQSSAANTR